MKYWWTYDQIMDKETGIFDLEEADNHLFDPLLAAMIYCLYKPTSLLDMGCGNGWYCRFFRDCFVSTVVGLEGTQGAGSLGIYEDIIEVDLTKPLSEHWNNAWQEEIFDLVICLEVGEHIPRKHERTFINNITEFVSKNLVLSWAIPEQPGRGHVNLKTNRYVVEKMEHKGLIFDELKTRTLREYCSLWWFRQSTMAFKKGGEKYGRA